MTKERTTGQGELLLDSAALVMSNSLALGRCSNGARRSTAARQRTGRRSRETEDDVMEEVRIRLPDAHQVQHSRMHHAESDAQTDQGFRSTLIG